MPTVIIALALGLIALLSGKNKKAGDDFAPTGPDGVIAPSGALTVAPLRNAGFTVDNKAFRSATTGKFHIDAEVPRNAKVLSVHGDWAAKNEGTTPRVLGLRLKWIHKRGGQPDDVWADFQPYDVAGQIGLVEDEIKKDVGAGHNMTTNVLIAAPSVENPRGQFMATIQPGETMNINIFLSMPGPGASPAMLKFWKAHDGNNFKLELELIADGAKDSVGSYGGQPVRVIERGSYPDFMTLKLGPEKAPRGQAHVTISQPTAASYEAFQAIPYDASLQIINPETFPEASPLEWIFRVKTGAGTTGWGKLDGASGVAAWKVLGEYEMQAAVADSAKHDYAGDAKTVKFNLVKARPRVVIDLPNAAPKTAGDTVKYSAHVEGQGETVNLPIRWKFKKDNGAYEQLGAGGQVTLITGGSYEFRAEVSETDASEFSDAATVIVIAAKPSPVNKFILGDNVTDGWNHGFVSSLELRDGSWWYHFQDQFGFARKVMGSFLSLYVAPAVQPPIVQPADLGPDGVDDGTGQDDLPDAPIAPAPIPEFQVTGWVSEENVEILVNPAPVTVESGQVFVAIDDDDGAVFAAPVVSEPAPEPTPTETFVPIENDDGAVFAAILPTPGPIDWTEFEDADDFI